ERPPVTATLPLAVEGVHVGDLHVEDRLDGGADLGLGRRGVHLEGVDVLLEQAVRLLAHHRLDDDVARILHWSSSVSSASSAGSSAAAGAGASEVVSVVGSVAVVKTTQSLQRMSEALSAAPSISRHEGRL